jgi:acetylornithine deacetylase
VATALEAEALAADVGALVRIPSVTGEERAAVEALAALARRLGLEAEVDGRPLEALRATPGHPGEEAPRSELVEVRVRRAGRGAGRIALCGHLDVVDAGEEGWDAWSGQVDGGFVSGRGSADMKGGVVAALHAMAAAEDPAPEVVLLGVASEEDGGLGAWGALERDAAFDACLIPEPTGFDVACVQAGALTFAGVVPGVAAHAALRRDGISALDRYIPVHGALAALEDELNAAVDHPLMRELELPYPVSVGRVAAGRWSSTVPDRLEFEGRVGVPVGVEPAAVRARTEAAVHGACPEAELRWTGGQFASGETPADHPWVRLVHACVQELVPASRPIGVPYGSDLRHFTARRIPCVMVGTGGLERAHARDERVAIDDIVRLARVIARVLERFGR